MLNLLMYVGFIGFICLCVHFENRTHPWVRRVGRRFGRREWWE